MASQRDDDCHCRNLDGIKSREAPTGMRATAGRLGPSGGPQLLEATPGGDSHRQYWTRPKQPSSKTGQRKVYARSTGPMNARPAWPRDYDFSPTRPPVYGALTWHDLGE
ncbi:hypothetical protein IscW_ISCW020988 [Ixodes scapularis]|uniref:Uncharacterized protein n=1 Tax=Ixodes scapularis TaxID=6945 RepID=B7Q5S9_IXOSC|nr:hypothetical protein IscW_ISCW020988 [Ixodes scapularis]|eukprot:XP_002402228.1 hypothetical protein IscW_ISCW020988 [Ixodes scapularis]